MVTQQGGLLEWEKKLDRERRYQADPRQADPRQETPGRQIVGGQNSVGKIPGGQAPERQSPRSQTPGGQTSSSQTLGRTDHPSDSPWVFVRGSSSVQTAWVPKKLVFIAASLRL